MKPIDFLPIGSIVKLEGGVRTIMIIARAILADCRKEEKQYFEYGGCLYPEGVITDQMLYFNQENIAQIVRTGYSNEEDSRLSQILCEWLEQSGYPKGTPAKWNEAQGGKEG